MSTVSKLRVRVVDDEIIVTLPGSRYSVIYYPPETHPSCSPRPFPTRTIYIAMTVSEFLAKAWRLANDKAKEVGWII
jgi:hypothetical protein